MFTSTKTQNLPSFEITEEAKELFTPLLFSLVSQTHNELEKHTNAFMDTSVFVDHFGNIGIAFGFKSVVDDYQAIYMIDFFEMAEHDLEPIAFTAKEFGSIYHHKLLGKMINDIADNAKTVVMLKKDELNKNLNKKTKKVIENSIWLDTVDYVIDDFGMIR